MPLDFFQRQADTQAQSRVFFFAFAGSVLGAAFILYFALTACFLLWAPGDRRPAAAGFDDISGSVVQRLPRAIYGSPPRLLAVRPILILGSLITLVILGGAAYKTRAIRNGGGAYIAVTLGGELLDQPRTMQEKQLVNVVEEMAVAAGLPRPAIFILPEERNINAVSAGLDQDDAVIAVTKGALGNLNRDELQGVMAHELGHILNGDCALNLTMAGWLHGLLLFYIAGKNMGGSLVALAAGLLLMIGGGLGKLAAECAQAALSRTREYMADAFAVQFTRNPAGLAGALKKIAARGGSGRIRNGQAQALRSFFIVSPSSGFSLFRTHPPLESRIMALEPSWDGSLPALPQLPPARLKPTGAAPAARKHLLDKLQNLPLDRAGTLALALASGSPPAGGLDSARRLYREIPEPLKAAAGDPAQAQALVAAVFMPAAEPDQARPRALIGRILGEGPARAAAGLLPLVAGDFKLPLLSLAAPALKQLNPAAKENLNRAVRALIAADGKFDLFELAAALILKKSIGLTLAPKAGDARPGLKLAEQLQSDAAQVLSALAQVGAADPAEAAAAFKAALAHLPQWPPLPLADPGAVKTKELLAALERLTAAPTRIKQGLVEAAVACALHDRRLNQKEYELLRALAAALDNPLPFYDL